MPTPIMCYMSNKEPEFHFFGKQQRYPSSERKPWNFTAEVSEKN